MSVVEWFRRQGLLLASVLVVAGAVGWAGWVHLLPAEQRDVASSEFQYWLALVVLVGGVLGWLARHRQAAAGPGAASRPVGELAELLATAMRREWEKVAADRKLLAPTPIPLRWTLLGDGMDEAVSTAVADASLRPAFPPLPGLVTVGQDALLAGGGQTELHAIYGGLGSGRLLLAGTPGAGKTGAGILLLLDALAYRRTRKETERSEVPVPVILALTDWQAATRAFEDWVADRLAATMAFLSGRRGRADAAALIDAGHVSVILDGLDEIPAHLRPTVLEALSQTRLRVVLLTRTAALLEASGTRHLVDAPVVHLQPVPARVAADYLDRALPGPPPNGWAPLLDELRGDPDGPLAAGLSSPLALTLLRDTYHAGDDVGELVQLASAATPQALEDHLLARVIPAAYTPRAGQPAPSYDLARAEATLTFLAIQMTHEGTRDLRWWRVLDWTPAAPRVILTGLVFGLVGLLVLAGFGVGLVGGLVGGLRRATDPRRMGRPRLAAFLSRETLVVGLVGGLMFGLGGSVIVGSEYGLTAALKGLLMFGLVGGLVFGLVGGLVVALTRSGVDDTTPAIPRTSWRSDLRHGFVLGVVSGLVSGVVFWLVVGFVDGFVDAYWVGLGFGLPIGLGFGLGVGVGGSVTWQTALAFLQLHRKHGVPLRLMRFLEDACDKGVLRTVGAVYQFRHARLQDQLAAWRSGSSSLSGSAHSPDRAGRLPGGTQPNDSSC